MMCMTLSNRQIEKPTLGDFTGGCKQIGGVDLPKLHASVLPPLGPTTSDLRQRLYDKAFPGGDFSCHHFSDDKEIKYGTIQITYDGHTSSFFRTTTDNLGCGNTRIFMNAIPSKSFVMDEDDRLTEDQVVDIVKNSPKLTPDWIAKFNYGNCMKAVAAFVIHHCNPDGIRLALASKNAPPNFGNPSPSKPISNVQERAFIKCQAKFDAQEVPTVSVLWRSCNSLYIALDRKLSVDVAYKCKTATGKKNNRIHGYTTETVELLTKHSTHNLEDTFEPTPKKGPSNPPGTPGSPYSTPQSTKSKSFLNPKSNLNSNT